MKSSTLLFPKQNGLSMSKQYVVEKTLQVIITDDDLIDERELTEDLALEIAQGIDNYEWQQVGIDVVGVQ